MHIAIDRFIEYDELNNCLKNIFGDVKFFLAYDGKSQIEDNEDDDNIIVTYSTDIDLANGFVSDMSIFDDQNQDLKYAEIIAHKISSFFNCATICSAARIILNQDEDLYILFQDGKVFLTEDLHYYSEGTKIVELKYALPSIARRRLIFIK